MAASLIDGKLIAEQINAETAAEIARLKTQHNLTPGLAVVLVGDGCHFCAAMDDQYKLQSWARSRQPFLAKHYLAAARAHGNDN
jgi:5,10-methylene-tetrahydrofolate dehydrogenase/methenyl tetrahydrofolate cyclohydrolase